ncbi:MAG: winged helix-turn-helix domain-containing protein, partial [Bdellovibrionota bacterium]
AITHLGYIQIDTISVVERAHHHVIWSRVPDYRPEFLQQLVAEKKQVFEYWSHAASFLPMGDFRFSLPRKRRYATGDAHWFTPTDEHKKWRRRILSQIKAEGSLSIRAFSDPNLVRKKGAGGWFERSPAKQMIEQLFMEGKLMVSGRQGFDKVYDLTERFLPSSVDVSFPSVSEQAQHLIRSHLRAHGIMRVEEIGHLRKKETKDLLAKEAKKLLKEGELVELLVEGIEEPYLALANWEKNLRRNKEPVVKILSPFDSQVIRRARASELFGFDYTIECYVPEAKRKFGYFVLPVLEAGRFIGRIDAKADRAEKVLIVKKVFGEKGMGGKREILARLKQPLQEFAQFNGCEEVQLLSK